MRLKIVPVEPTREMQIAGTQAVAARLMKVREFPAIAYAAMLAATPPLTAEEIDQLCAIWFGGRPWEKYEGEWMHLHALTGRLRNKQRAKMSAFIAALEKIT